MPVLSNQRYEKFAQELAQGKTADESYRLAGYKPHRGNASTLRTNQSILDRVAELQGKIVDSIVENITVTIESLIKEADRIQKKAEKANQFSAATGALKLKSEYAGLYVQRREDATPPRTARDVDTRIHSIVKAERESGASRSAGGETTH